MDETDYNSLLEESRHWTLEDIREQVDILRSSYALNAVKAFREKSPHPGLDTLDENGKTIISLLDKIEFDEYLRDVLDIGVVKQTAGTALRKKIWEGTYDINKIGAQDLSLMQIIFILFFDFIIGKGISDLITKNTTSYLDRQDTSLRLQYDGREVATIGLFLPVKWDGLKIRFFAEGNGPHPAFFSKNISAYINFLGLDFSGDFSMSEEPKLACEARAIDNTSGAESKFEPKLFASQKLVSGELLNNMIPQCFSLCAGLEDM